MNNPYVVKCDECGKTFKTNVSMLESVQGGRCQICKKKDARDYQYFLKQAKEQDKKRKFSFDSGDSWFR